VSRVTWFAAGAVTGVYGLVKARRAARNLTPDGIAARMAAVGAGLRVFTSEVSAGMAEREAELRDHLTLPRPGAVAGVPPMIEQSSPSRHGREDGPDGHR
jgi:hypothetical protein